jgi:hypothetical protein
MAVELGRQGREGIGRTGGNGRAMAADLAAGVQQMLATADPILGRVLRWTHQNGARVVGRFVELATHRRIVVTCGWRTAA